MEMNNHDFKETEDIVKGKAEPIYTSAVESLKEENQKPWAVALPSESEQKVVTANYSTQAIEMAKRCQLCDKSFPIYYDRDPRVFCPECIKKLRHVLGIEV